MWRRKKLYTSLQYVEEEEAVYKLTICGGGRSCIQAYNMWMRKKLFTSLQYVDEEEAVYKLTICG